MTAQQHRHRCEGPLVVDLAAGPLILLILLVHWCRCGGDLAALLRMALVAEDVSLYDSVTGGTVLQALQHLGGSLRTLDICNMEHQVGCHTSCSPYCLIKRR